MQSRFYVLLSRISTSEDVVVPVCVVSDSHVIYAGNFTHLEFSLLFYTYTNSSSVKEGAK